MKFSDKQIDMLRRTVGERLSEKRFHHTLGVEKMALYIGEKIMPESLSELSSAALLHDISKEYSEAEHFNLIKTHNISLSESDLKTPAIWHSITAPLVILDEFPQFATEQILSAVRNHTAGAPDMSVFDEIIFLADYIEEGRSFSMCCEVRDEFFNLTEKAESLDDYIQALHSATLSSLNNTIKFFVSRNKSYHEMTELTRDAILAKTER